MISPLQICNGLAAGNIGDEFMNRAFWDALPGDVRLEVEVFPNHALQRAPYPAPHRYREIGWDGRPLPEAGRPAVLVGDTPVTEALGVDWPLRFLAPRLAPFHAAGQPVDALGVGVEPLRSSEARRLFEEAFLPIRSWTVRSARCRDALLDLGVAADRVRVGADWAWCYRPRADRASWAAGAWRASGIDLGEPLLVVNVVNEIWADRDEVKSALAAALDALAGDGFQVAFFCNEMREGGFFDRAASEAVAARLKSRSVILPNLYYAPDEVLGLLHHATVTVGTRYHFIVESVLADTVVVPLTRSAKTEGLVEELALTPGGTLDAVDARVLASAVRAATGERDALRLRLRRQRARLLERASENLAFWAPTAAA